MIDIGVNFINKQFKGKQEPVIKNAKEVGVTHIIATGTSMSNSIQSIEFAKKSGGYVTTTVGVHPHNAKELKSNEYNKLKEMCLEEVVVAVGECGLDYDRNFSSKEDQIRAFKMQLDIAREIQKPLFLHEREAVEDFVKIMSEYSDLIPKSVVHCFTGDKETLQRYLDLGFMIGITGWICDDVRGGKLQEAIKTCPLDRLMIETDSPFLKPKNILPKTNSRTNEPKNLPYVARKIAELKNIEVNEVIQATKSNTECFFKINQ